MKYGDRLINGLKKAGYSVEFFTVEEAAEKLDFKTSEEFGFVVCKLQKDKAWGLTVAKSKVVALKKNICSFKESFESDYDDAEGKLHDLGWPEDHELECELLEAESEIEILEKIYSQKFERDDLL
ncbi:hypothetical protein [Methanococcus maripaludis]|uniref:Uncharacterized protein n=1 Tax=Methanococcus maripaludis TaxID=39152 RepID=A0A7J9PCU1_METMI|nr:hypothetical protein [Methanococcus maripaludis]MBA2860971.1 hypothetical protein [Methanococcus maripaludis]